MIRISDEEVRHIALLARLSLSDRQVEEMAHDLDQVLDYVETLQELDTTDIEPTAHAIPLATPTRADEAVPAMDPELAIASAPESAGSAFRVPKVIDGEEGG